MRKRSIVLGVISIILFVSIIFVSVIILNAYFSKYYQSGGLKNAEEYEKKLMQTFTAILLNTKLASHITEEISSAWYSAAESGSMDYNLAIKTVVLASKESGLIDKIEKNHSTIKSNLELLRVYPGKYKAAYNALFNLYLIYSEIYELSINPPRPLTYFDTRISYLESRYIRALDKLKSLLPSEESLNFETFDSQKTNTEDSMETKTGTNLDSVDLQAKVIKKNMSYREVERLSGVPRAKKRDPSGKEVWIYPAQERGYQDCIFFSNGKVVKTKKELDPDTVNSELSR